MSTNNQYRFMIAAGILVPLALCGCRTRGGFIGELLSDKSSQIVAGKDDPASAAQLEAAVEAAADSEKPSDADLFGWDDPDGSQEVALSRSGTRSSQMVLEEAGAVLEFDPHGRPVGADLTQARLSREVTRSVAELSELQWLDLRGARITDADLALIGSLPRLQLIALGDSLVTDAGLRHLKHQKDLRFLSLDRTAVTESGLSALAGLPRLEGLSLLGTSVSREGAAAFESLTPGCRVILDEDAPATSSESRLPSRAERVKPSTRETGTGNTGRSSEPLDLEWMNPAPAEPSTPSGRTYNPETIAARPPAAFPAPEPAAPEHPIPVVKDVTQTRANLNEVLQRKLADPEVLAALSQHLIAQQDYPKAIPTLEALLELRPDNLEAHFDLGVALARSGQFDAAKPHFAAVVGEATALYNLGIIAYELDRPAYSQWYFARALEIAPHFSEARSWLARAQQKADATGALQAPLGRRNQDLVNLLMDEFGGDTSTPQATTPKMEIVPAKRTASEPTGATVK